MNKSKKTFIFLILITYNSIAFAKTNFFSAPYNQKVKFISWKAHMQKNFQESLCDKNGLIINCYQVSTSNCKMHVAKNFNACIVPYRKMKQITPYKQGLVLGKKIGFCLGERIDVRLNKRNGGRCDLL